MAVPFSNTKLRVPRGFQNLLEGLAREVLRSQPSDVYAFGASYFEALIQKRLDTGIDPVEIGAKLEDRFYNNKAFTNPEVDPSNPQQQDAARAIQTKYRQHAAKQEVDALREEKAATTIQAGFRGYQDRMMVVKLRENQEQRGADREGEDVDFEQMKSGFKARKEAQAQAKVAEAQATEEPRSEVIDIDLNDPDVQDAAILIQAGFRGMMMRKKNPEAARGPAAEKVGARTADTAGGSHGHGIGGSEAAAEPHVASGDEAEQPSADSEATGEAAEQHEEGQELEEEEEKEEEKEEEEEEEE